MGDGAKQGGIPESSELYEEYPRFFERDARFDFHRIAEDKLPEYSRIIANRLADMLDADPTLATTLERDSRRD